MVWNSGWPDILWAKDFKDIFFAFTKSDVQRRLTLLKYIRPLNKIITVVHTIVEDNEHIATVAILPASSALLEVSEPESMLSSASGPGVRFLSVSHLWVMYAVEIPFSVASWPRAALFKRIHSFGTMQTNSPGKSFTLLKNKGLFTPHFVISASMLTTGLRTLETFGRVFASVRLTLRVAQAFATSSW